LCPRVHTSTHVLALSGLSLSLSLSLSLWSLSPSVALSPRVHIIFVVVPLPNLFPRAAPSTRRLVPFSPSPPLLSIPLSLSLSLSLSSLHSACSGASLFVIYIVWGHVVDEIAKGVSGKEEEEEEEREGEGSAWCGRLVWRVKGPVRKSSPAL